MKNFYIKNIDTDTIRNDNFRKVVFTGDHLQLVLMSIDPGTEIGGEVHFSVDQFFRIESGVGKVIIEDTNYEISKDFGIVIPAGTSHNIINTGNEPLKLYSIYAPPQHPKGIIEPVQIKETIKVKTFQEYFKLENTEKINETGGLNYKDLPDKVYRAMSYEFNTDYPEIKKALLMIKKWTKDNLNKLESGLDPYEISKKGTDFLKISKILECTPMDIVEYIFMQMDGISDY